MNLFKSRLVSSWLMLTMALVTVPLARADVIYTYTGNDFINADGSDITTADFVSASLVFASALPPSTTSTLAPLSWIMNAGPLTLTSATSDYDEAGTLTLSITTDATGAIVKWDLTAVGPFVTNASPSNATLITAGEIGGGAFDWADDPLGGGDGGGPQTAGTWKFVAGVPEPSSLALLGAGLIALLTWVAWQRRRISRSS